MLQVTFTCRHGTVSLNSETELDQPSKSNIELSSSDSRARAQGYSPPRFNSASSHDTKALVKGIGSLEFADAEISVRPQPENVAHSSVTSTHAERLLSGEPNYKGLFGAHSSSRHQMYVSFVLRGISGRLILLFVLDYLVMFRRDQVQLRKRLILILSLPLMIHCPDCPQRSLVNPLSVLALLEIKHL